MKNSELIALLQQCDPDDEAWIGHETYEDAIRLDEIKVLFNGEIILTPTTLAEWVKHECGGDIGECIEVVQDGDG